jgi:hypothetical protein
MDTKYSTLLRLATRRGLAEHDPWLALEVAKHWAKQPGKQTDVERLMQAELAKPTTEIGYRELDTWYHDSFRKMVDARTARLARAKPTRRKLAGSQPTSRNVHRMSGTPTGISSSATSTLEQPGA